MDWIACAERLPVIDTDVLCFLKEHGPDGYVIAMLRPSPYSGWDSADDSFDLDQVTHWMPLPAPPLTKGAG